MKVSEDYYDTKFDRPETVKHVVTWCKNQERACRKEGNRPGELIAKRIKSLCLKNYKLAKGMTARFCKEWEEHPEAMYTWIITQFPNGRCMLVRHDKKADFEPSNVTLKPQS